MEMNLQGLEHMRKLFIGGLHPSTTTETLQQYFSQFGNVLEAKVMRDQSGKTRGFGFITYEDASMVDKAQEGRPHEIDGKVVESKRLVPRTDINKPESRVTVKKVFVGGVKNEHEEEVLREYFEKFGNVVNVHIVSDANTGRRKGYAFVEFDDYDSVDKVILQKIHLVKGILLDVKKALSKQMTERFGRNNHMDMQHSMSQMNNLMSSNYSRTYSGTPQWSNSNGYGANNDSYKSNDMMANGSQSNWSPQSSNANWNYQNPNWSQSQSGQSYLQNTNQFPQQNRRNYQSNRMNSYPNKKMQGYSGGYNNAQNAGVNGHRN